jgi:KaiC/GvpD/RAD55 family RecA-like ATPase
MTSLPTGIDVLDRKLNGGIPPGRLVVLSASPTSQSELFLYEVASVRETIYVTTERSVTAVEETLDGIGTDRRTVSVHGTGEDPLATVTELLDDVGDRTAFIVDPVCPLEQESDPAAYRQFLNDLTDRMIETGSIAVLHCLDRRTVPENRDTTEYMADIVFDLSTDVRGDSLENRLVVPKFRGGSALDEMIKLNLAADVTIDISRKIA